MSYITNHLDFHEMIDAQNSKSKKILDEYERIAVEKRENYKEEENVLHRENEEFKKKINDLRDKIDKINDLSNKSKDKYKDVCDIHEIIDDLENQIETNNRKIDKIHSREIYPHGNGIYGFALAYHEISKKIDVEWTEPIWTWTIKGYKRVYPENATHYIQYKEDVKTSSQLLRDIERYLLLKNKNYRELFWSDWVLEINEYLKENNITLNDDVVFRPIIHDTMIMDTDILEYYRITKSDLEDKDDGEEDEYDYFDYFLDNLNMEKKN